jgi:carboxyl-terminal processing protease
MSSRLKYVVVGASTCLTLLLLVGGLAGQGSVTQEDTLKHIGVFSDVVARIKTEYVEEPDMKSVTQGALNGMLEAVDPFASYLNPEQYQEYLKNKDLSRADVGLRLSKRFGYIGVVSAIPGSPAAKAGFATGDMIETIKGISTRDMPLAYANLLLQGEPGSTVELTAVHVRSQQDPQKVTLTRTNVAIAPVESSMLAGQSGYINVDGLGPAQLKQIAQSVQKLQSEGARKLVLDLRACAVGTPDEGIALANLFLDKGLITYMKGQRVEQKNFDADPSKAVTKLPLAVLVDRGTAGGAEIAAAALQDDDRAKLVGEATYGDAAMREAIKMDDGGAIILSVAKYYSPKGQAIQDTRVTPATLVAQAEPEIEYDANGDPLPQSKPQQPDQKTSSDSVVIKALEVLNK